MIERYGRESQGVSLLAKDQYMREVHWSDFLGDEERGKLLQRIQQARREPANQWLAMRAKYARERLVEGYQPVIVSLARRYAYYARGMEMLDFVQEGSIAFLQALDRTGTCDPRSFTAFMLMYVRGAMLRVLRESDGVIRLPKHASRALRKLAAVEQEIGDALGRLPLLSELAEKMGVTEEKVREMMEWRRFVEVESLQKLAFEDEDYVDMHELTSVFPSSDTSEHALDQEIEQGIRLAIETVLTEKQREVIQLRYGSEDVVPAAKVARMLGKGETVIHKHERYAMKKLQAALAPLVAGMGA